MKTRLSPEQLAAIRAGAEKYAPRQLELLGKFAAIDCGTGDREGNRRVVELVQEELSALPADVTLEEGPNGCHVVARIEPERPTGKIILNSHLDTVFHPGDTAAHPFRVEGDWAWGLGVADCKGGFAVSAYGVRVAWEAGLLPQKEIVMVYGCDEETGFEDLRYYLEKEEPPVYGFTPDCKFPVVYAERGRAVVRIWGREPEPFYAFVTQYFIGAKNTGDRLGIDFSHPEYGVMEMRGYKLGICDGTSYFEASLSYPAGHGIQEILERIREKVEGLEVTLEQNYDPVVFDKDSPMVQALTGCYEAVTKEEGTPVTTTGGTYAKAMPGIVPFGPSFAGQKGIGHNPNEWMKVEDLMKNARIYALALYRLGRL